MEGIVSVALRRRPGIGWSFGSDFSTGASIAWIVFKSRAHRDEVNAKVMKDPRLAAMDPNTMPFDCKRMAYGGFEVLVEDVAPVPDRV